MRLLQNRFEVKTQSQNEVMSKNTNRFFLGPKKKGSVNIWDKGFKRYFLVRFIEKTMDQQNKL